MSTNGTADWQMLTLGELTENHDSVRVPVKESERRSGSYPCYGASGMVRQSRAKYEPLILRESCRSAPAASG